MELPASSKMLHFYRRSGSVRQSPRLINAANNKTPVDNADETKKAKNPIKRGKKSILLRKG